MLLYMAKKAFFASVIKLRILSCGILVGHKCNPKDPYKKEAEEI